MSRKSGKLWRENDEKANKDGVRHSIYWVEKNPSYLEAKRLKLDETKHSTFRSSTMYKGSWKSNKKHGFGKMTYSNGSIYEGEWENGKRHGKGTSWVKEGQRIRKEYTGDWEFGKQNGLGCVDGLCIDGLCTVMRVRFSWYTHSVHLFTSPFRKRIFYYEDGSKYEGMWEKNLRHGRGKYFYANQDVYDGEWRKGQRHGVGKVSAQHVAPAACLVMS